MAKGLRLWGSQLSYFPILDSALDPLKDSLSVLEAIWLVGFVVGQHEASEINNGPQQSGGFQEQ